MESLRHYRLRNEMGLVLGKCCGESTRPPTWVKIANSWRTLFKLRSSEERDSATLRVWPNILRDGAVLH